jgi:hypothetical protein
MSIFVKNYFNNFGISVSLQTETGRISKTVISIGAFQECGVTQNSQMSQNLTLYADVETKIRFSAVIPISVMKNGGKEIL